MDVSSIVKALSVISTGGMQTMTNYDLAKEMVDNVNFDWDDPTKTIYDPWCGSGMFLLACAAKLYDHGHTPKHIVTKMLFGSDIDEVQGLMTKRALQLFCDVPSNIEQKDLSDEV